MAKGGDTQILGPDGRPYASIEAFTTSPILTAFRARMGAGDPRPISDIANVEPVLAHISADIWCVDCPDCNGGEQVWLTGPLVTFCNSCGNAALGGKWRPVVFPDDREEIEAILDKRPRRDHRNWRAPETPDELRLQNQDAGDAV